MSAHRVVVVTFTAGGEPVVEWMDRVEAVRRYPVLDAPAGAGDGISVLEGVATVPPPGADA